MPIDPSVLLYGLQPQAREPYDAPDVVAERQARVQQLREAAKAKQDAEYENQLYDWAVKSNLGPDGQPDMEGVRKSLAAVAPRYLRTFDAAVNTAKKSQAETYKLTDDHNEANAKYLANWATGIDQTNYGDRLNFLQQNRPDLAQALQLPPTYDPAVTPTHLKTIQDAGTAVTEQNRVSEATRKLALDGEYDKAIAKWIDAHPELKDDDTSNKLYENFLGQMQNLGAPQATIQPWQNKSFDQMRASVPNVLTTPHERETEAEAQTRLSLDAQKTAAEIAGRAETGKRADDAAKALAAYREATLNIQRMNATTSRMREQLTQTKDATTQSYNASKTRLDTLRKPVEDTLNKVSELSDLVEQHNPQADALIPPKLITVMVGGMGTGVRLTQGEIERVVGGRTNFEALQAQLNKWRLDPSKGLSLTEPQRQQIRDIVSTVSQKATSKIARIQKADADLLEAPDTRGQRQVIVDLQKDVEDLAGGQPAGGGGATTKMLRVGQNAPFQVTKQPDGTWKSASGGIYDDSGTRLR